MLSRLQEGFTNQQVRVRVWEGISYHQLCVVSHCWEFRAMAGLVASIG